MKDCISWLWNVQYPIKNVIFLCNRIISKISCELGINNYKYSERNECKK